MKFGEDHLITMCHFHDKRITLRFVISERVINIKPKCSRIDSRYSSAEHFL